MRHQYWTGLSASQPGSRFCLQRVSFSRSRTTDLSPRKRRKSASHTTRGTCISQSYVLIRNQRILLSRKIAVTAASPTPTRFRFFSTPSTIARTRLSFAQVPRVSSTTDKSQKPAKVIPAHLRRAAVSVRGAELVRVVHNAEAPPLSTATGMVSGWEAEMVIPFRTLRYVPGAERVWGLQIMRNLRRHNEQSYWTPISRAFDLLQVVSQESWKAWICACIGTCN